MAQEYCGVGWCFVRPFTARSRAHLSLRGLHQLLPPATKDYSRSSPPCVVKNFTVKMSKRVTRNRLVYNLSSMASATGEVSPSTEAIELETIVTRTKVSRNAVRPLIDHGHKVKMSTLAPRHGEFTVDSASLWSEFQKEPFYALVALPTPVLLLLYLMAYSVFIFTTAFLFWLIALGDPNTLLPDSSWQSCCLCAWQSVTTVGYGAVTTNSAAANVVGAVAVVLCLVFDAVGIGVFYQHISNPADKKASILHSTCACISRAQPGMPIRFECRVHHLADYALVSPSCKLTLARFHTGQDGAGRVSIEFEELQISNKCDRSAFLQYPWSVVHFVDERSALAKYIQTSASGEPKAGESFGREHVEIICSVNGAAATTGDSFESRHSYTLENTRFGHCFADALIHTPNGTLSVDVSQLSETMPEDPANLLKPQCF